MSENERYHHHWHAHGDTVATRTTPVPELERKSAAAFVRRELPRNYGNKVALLPPLPSSSSCCVAAHHQPDPQFSFIKPHLDTKEGACPVPVPRVMSVTSYHLAY